MKDRDEYSKDFEEPLRNLCKVLDEHIDTALKTSQCTLYHGAPVWFIEDNPIVGYSKKSNKIAVLFWSGQSFSESGLSKLGKFKAAEIQYADEKEINYEKLDSWLLEAETIIWNYKDLPKTQGILNRLPS